MSATDTTTHPATPPAAERARLRVDLARAAHLVAPAWPLEDFVAVNPVVGLLEAGFDAATAEARRWFGARTHPGPSALRAASAQGELDEDDLRIAVIEVTGTLDGPSPSTVDQLVDDLLGRADPPAPPVRPRTALERVDAVEGLDRAALVDAEAARWCGVLVDRAHLPFALPDGGAYGAWRAMAAGDRGLARLAGWGGRGGRGVRAWLAALPERADDAVLDLLDALGVAPTDHAAELRGQLARLPGWAGYARWCDEWAPADAPVPHLGLLDLMALRLALDALALRGAGVAPGQVPVEGDPAGAPPVDADGRLILHALEGAYRRRLLTALDRDPMPGPAEAAAQAVFCIDARSEGLRRHLEAVGPYDTLGFAGFFAVPLRHRPLGSTEAYASTPVLLTPAVEVPEVAAPGAEAEVARRQARDARSMAAGRTVAAVAHGPLSMYALAEGAGWLLGPAAMARTVRPRPPAPAATAGTRVVAAEELVGTGDGTTVGFTLEDRVLIAETALRTMGLTAGFAPLVLVCGHGSTTSANPHAAALDCGACGGNRGGPNARAAATILNDPAVRSALAERGIDVPADTWFVAGEHDTATDEVRLLDADAVPAAHRPALAVLADDLVEAGRRLTAERLGRLPGAKSGTGAARARSGDWAEPRPEWGLARNAAFVVGHRDLTRGLDLGTRTFLHSYDAEADVDGTALETILTAPMVVAHSINAQYYFSTVDPDRFGAGDKTVHNVVAGIGVLAGEGGDLRGGLPLQSVWAADGSGHLPVRLLTVVDAPGDRVEAVIDRNPILGHLFDGAWVHLVARHPGTGTWRRRLPGGRWIAPVGCSPEVVPA